MARCKRNRLDVNKGGRRRELHTNFLTQLLESLTGVMLYYLLCYISKGNLSNKSRLDLNMCLKATLVSESS